MLFLFLFHVEQKTEYNQIYITCADHALTGDRFQLKHDLGCDMLITDPQPNKDELKAYYNIPDYPSHEDKKTSLFQRAYFFARYLSAKKKLLWALKHKGSGGSLLDIGAGVGYFVRSVQAKGFECIGIETNRKARDLANTHKPNTVFEASQLEIIKPKSQSVITLWHVLEHLPDLDFQIQTLKNLLVLNGSIIVAVPNFKSFDAQYFKSYWAAYDVPRHLWHFSQTAISNLFERHNMEVHKIYPMTLDAYYVSLLSTKYKSGKINIIKALFIGLCSNIKAFFTGEYSSLVYVLKNKSN